MSAPATDPAQSFPHNWEAEVLPARPVILPARHFIYPRDADEVERGALEVMVRPATATSQQFLATCALGFRDPAVPTGLWSAPNPDELCAVSGGYAYLIDTTSPDQFTMIPHRPVLAVQPAPAANLLLFVGNRTILAWGPNGQAWESEKLSDEGVTVSGVDGLVLSGTGWAMLKDIETNFTLDLTSGRLIP